MIKENLKARTGRLTFEKLSHNWPERNQARKDGIERGGQDRTRVFIFLRYRLLFVLQGKERKRVKMPETGGLRTLIKREENSLRIEGETTC